MREVTYILRVKIVRNRSKIIMALSQDLYIKKILERFYMTDYKPMDTPILKMCIKTSQEHEQIQRRLYFSVIESIIYAMICMRPDIFI